MRKACLMLSMVSMLAMPGAAARGQTPGSGLLTCNVLPANQRCEVQLAAKDTAVVVVVKPGATTLAGVTELIVTSSGCCTDSTRVGVDGSGQVRIRWSAASTPDDTVHLYVMIPQSAGGTRQGEVLLLPPRAAEVRAIRVAEHSVDNQYVWVRGGYVPARVTVDVPGLGNQIVSESDCAKIRFSVVPNVEGKATPDSGYARWEPGHDGSSGTCRMETRWKLGDAQSQQLDVKLSGTNLQTNHVRVRGIARLDPRVMGGLGRFRNIIRNVECNSRDERPQCAALDSFPQTISTRTSGIEPYGAVEFPLIFMTRFRGAFARFVFERVRLVGGTTLRHPERNPFAAVNVMPLAIPSLEGVPFQLTVGTTLGASRDLFYGVSVDAHTITAPLVGIFGIN